MASARSNAFSAVDVRVDDGGRDVAVHLDDADVDPPGAGIPLFASTGRCRLDHLRSGDLVERLVPVGRPLGQVGMECAPHALRVRVEPPLEVVEGAADDGVFVRSHQRSSAILAAAFAAPSVSTGT